MTSLHSLYNRISSIDFEIAAEEEEEHAEISALQMSNALRQELKDAKELQSAVVAALMSAVSEIRSSRGSSGSGTPPGSATSGILRRYFS